MCIGGKMSVSRAFGPRLLRPTRAALLAVAALYVSGGCYDSVEVPSGPARATVAPRAVNQSQSIITIDDALRNIEALVPGFAGLYVNDDEELVIRLRDLTRGSLAPQAVFQVLGRFPGRRGAPIRIQAADYAFSELQGWMRQLLRSASFEGIVVADIDERDNRLTFGVESQAIASRLLGDLTRLGIPRAAADIQTMAYLPKLSATIA
jgi:hypothetical protein